MVRRVSGRLVVFQVREEQDVGDRNDLFLIAISQVEELLQVNRGKNGVI